MPPDITAAADGTQVQTQVLFRLGEISTQLAVISEQLKWLPDHEARLRALERFRWTIAGLALAGGAAASFAGYVIGHLAGR